MKRENHVTPDWVVRAMRDSDAERHILLSLEKS
jgi:hypothetical protein